MTCCPPADRNPGDYPLETLPEGWSNAQVHYVSKGNVYNRFEILDANGIRYQQEPMAMIAFKCCELFLVGVPLYCLAYTALHLARLPVVTLWNCSPTAFLKQVWAIVRIPFYFIGMECAALYGIFKPLDGRALFGKLESSLHDGKGYRDAVQHEKNDQPFLNVAWNALSKKEDPYAFFIAFCMQSLGKTTDPHIRNVLPQIPQAV